MSRRLLPSSAASLLGAVLLGVAAAQAGEIDSRYSSTAPKDCRVSSAGSGLDDSTIRVCPGPQRLVVLISEDDLRETVSVGRSAAAAAREPAAKLWFGPFNSTTPRVEWRADGGKPFAMIQRWHIADNDDPGKDGRPRSKALLVVTRLPPGAVCHVAYIDVAANPDPNQLARDAADREARDFKCGTPRLIGAPGRATALAAPR
jgi:hypothetical protein